MKPAPLTPPKKLLLREIIKFDLEQVKPEQDKIFQSQGIPPAKEPPDRVKTLYNNAEKLFYTLAEPVGIISGISIEEFAKMYARQFEGLKMLLLQNLDDANLKIDPSVFGVQGKGAPEETIIEG